MKMEEMDLEEDVQVVVIQEANAIKDVLCMQKDNVLQQIYALVEARTREQLLHLPNPRETISGVVDYFKTSDQHTCRHFLETFWAFCDDIPLELDTKIIHAAGPTAGALVDNSHLPDNENFPPSHNAKRACIDQVQSYTNAVKSFLQKKFEKVTKDMTKKVCLDKTWLCWRTQKCARMRDRPTKSQEGEEVLPEHKESVESLMKKTGRVVMLSGQAGSGKTLLMHCLGHHWAQGSYPSIELLFLLEFRQLNLVSQPLSLKELLFRFFLPSEEDNEQSEAVLTYAFNNPEKICFIFDGYDEFAARFTDPEELVDSVNAYQQLPLADLLSALCSSKILPGCTVLVTCRPRDVFDLFGSSGYFVAELLGFNQQRVKEYTEEYFHEKGNEIKEKAVRLLMDNYHLLSMSYVPGLCHVCCVCIDYFLSSDMSQQSGTQLPTSLTQIYLHILSAFISRCQSCVSSDNHTPLLQKYRDQIAMLSKVAMDGLEKSRIVFSANELSPELMNFGANAGILSRLDLTCADGSRSLGCAFTHLTMQEFMAALHMMTNPDITESQLKKKLNLKSRWTAKTDPKTVFTDSLHLYMCGLAAEACTSNLIMLEGSENARTTVLKRQNAVLKILKSFVVSVRQTGPKIIELCRCTHETQNIDLAKAVGSRDRFELRNIRLNPVDIDALAFVTLSANQMVCLDFGACSIEPECLNIIPHCKNLESLIFRSRKYDDKFAEALSGILPKLQSLKQLDFISGSLSHSGASKLFKALQSCPQITLLNLSDNSLSDESVREITELIPKLTKLTSVMLGKNNISKNGIFMLVEKMAEFRNIKKVSANSKKEITILFSPFLPNTVGTDNLNNAEETRELIVNDWNLTCKNVQDLCSMLSDCSSLTVLNLSKNSLGNKGLKKLLENLHTLDTIQEINVSDNEVDMNGVMLLSTYLCTLKHLTEVEASYNGSKKLVLTFRCRRRTFKRTKEGCDVLHKKLSLIQCDIQPTDMSTLCKNLIKCPDQLDLDFSYGTLNKESIERLIKFLPGMSSLNLLNLSHIEMTTGSAFLIVQLLPDCQRITTVELRQLGQTFVTFLQAKSEAATCKLNQFKLNSADLSKLCGILQHCHRLTDLDLSSNFLKDEDVKSFVQCLPELQISNLVSLNDNSLTEVGGIYLLNLMNTCERVAAVEVSLGKERQQALIRFVQKNCPGKSFSLRHCCFELSHLHSLVEILSSCPKLKLELSSCTVQSQNLYFLLNKLPDLSSVQTLELRNNSFNEEAVKHLVTELCRDSNDRTIRIMEPWIKGEVAVGLVACCLEMNPHIKEIRVEKTWLNLTVKIQISDTVSNENGHFSVPAVQSISFDDCEVEGKHLFSLQSTVQKCPSLQELQFSQLTMGTGGAGFLSAVLPALKNLKMLSLDSRGETEDEAVIFALKNIQKNLEQLSLSHHVIRDSGASVLGNTLQSLTRMQSLSILQCLDCTTTGGLHLVRGLVQCHSLEEIRLDSLQLDKEIIDCFAKGLQAMKSLNKISLIKTVSKDSSEILCLLASLHTLTELKEIELIGLRMGDQGIEELVKHIPKWTLLRKINLSDNLVSDHAGEMLVKALSHCRALQEIHLARNNLGHSFAAVLPSLPKLSELDLSENQLGSKGCSSLCEGLVRMKALKKLHLTSIGTSDLVNVASCLKHCTSIEDISLSWNKCENDVVFKLVEVLPQCSKLKRLDLEANNIKTLGAKELNKCLQLCPWIEVIRLWRNPIQMDDLILKDKRLNFSST
ncbi:NLR family, CARD domain containing 5 isoform X2 [Silurus meridionalis]|uniref:NLR family, CARD domain containing 5 isoform X2 n=1 Tax=Silurus meridionalis TaxID=175797 RepID=UPI001EEBBE2E|nr:NLR family, CARD domain containing 5 isoform X2 [Silurus meridionalis]